MRWFLSRTKKRTVFWHLASGTRNRMRSNITARTFRKCRKRFGPFLTPNPRFVHTRSIPRLPTKLQQAERPSAIVINREAHRSAPFPFARLLPLLHHHLPQRPIDPRLISPPLPLKPCQNIRVQTQSNRLLDRFVESLQFRRQPPRPLSLTCCRLNTLHLPTPRNRFPLFHLDLIVRIH